MDKHLKKTVKKCLKNDRIAQFELYNLCFDHLMRTCQRYKRNREDAVMLLNDGFLKILLNLDKYDFQKSFWPWVSTVMVRAAIDDYRKNRHYEEETDLKEKDEELEQVQLQKPHQQVVNQLSGSDAQEMIFKLPEKERLVFNLYEWEGYQHREIATKLNCTERTSKRYLRSAKQKLKNMIEKRNDLKKVI